MTVRSAARVLASAALALAVSVLAPHSRMAALAQASRPSGQPSPAARPAPRPVSAATVATSPDAGPFASLRWRNIGPNRGGRSLAIAGSPSRPHEYYFGAVGGGLWKTSDGGTTWAPVTDGQLRSSSVGAVAVAESNPDIVYIGMGEMALRGDLVQGDGIYKSTDAGKTWRHVGLKDSQVVSRLRVHPSNPDVVFAAVFGHPSGPNEERGVYRSKDGGAHWERVLFRDAKTGAVDLAIDRTNPDVIYAALWEAYRVRSQVSRGGPGSGLFKSVDGGNTWTELTRNQGLPPGVMGKIGVTVSGASPSRVYAIVEHANGGVFRSDDGGGTWARVNDDRRLRQRAFYPSRIYADPVDADTVYVLDTGLYKSVDGGKTFATIKAPHVDHHDLWIDPGNPLRLGNANDGGGTVSVNGGDTWTRQDHPTAQIHHVATTRDVPYHVCGAQQDSTTLCVPSDGGPLSRGPGRPTGDWLYTVGGGESGYLAPHPVDPDIFYAGSQGAVLTRYNRRTGQTRDVQVYPRFYSGEASAELPERWQRTFPIVFSPHDPGVLYTASQHVWKTTDGGQRWERISGDLTKADPKTLGPSGSALTQDMNGPEVFAAVSTLAESPRAKGLIWAGSDDGLVHVTRDGGTTWQDVTPPDLPAPSRVSLVEASPHEEGTAWLTAKRHLLGDRAPHVYRTRDFGRTWTKIVAGIREDDFVHAVREDPVRKDMLYAGTEHGVWVSWDAGDSWRSLSLNLPDTRVADLVVEAHDLVAATHGRSFHVLDDIDCLRQWRPELAKARLHLFTPRTAVRSLSAAPIDYLLAEDAETVTIEILDAAGRTVRRIESSDALERHVKEANAQAEQGIGQRQPALPSRARGLNRYAWDLRYPGATVFEGMITWGARPERGPLAPPGTYRVRVSALGADATVPYVVEMDPRLAGVTEDDLRQQFDLAMQIRDRTSDANEAVIRIRDLKAQIAQRVPLARSPVIGLAADATSRVLTEVEQEFYQVHNRSDQDPLNFPIKLNNRLAALRRSVETGDARPTDAARAVFAELSAELDVLLDRLKSVEANHVAAFNRLLTNGGLAPIEPAAAPPRF